MSMELDFENPEKAIDMVGELEGEDLLCALNECEAAIYNGETGLDRLMDRLTEKAGSIQKAILDSHPMGEIKVRGDCFFQSVCCQRFKDDVVSMKVHIAIDDCMSSAFSMYTVDPELAEAAARSEGWDPDGGYIEFGKCPYCGKEMDEFMIPIDEE